MKRIVLALLFFGFSVSAYAQGNFVATNTTQARWSERSMNVATGQQCFSLLGLPVSVHDFLYQVRAGTASVSAVTITFSGTTDGTAASLATITTKTNAAGDVAHFTGVYTTLCVTVTTLTGAGGLVDISYTGSPTAPAVGSVTLSGDVTSGTASNFKSQVQGVAAEGAAVSGNPNRVSGVDGSGNTRTIKTDTSGDVQIGVPDGLDVTQGTTTVAQCTTTDTTACTVVGLLKGNLAQLKLIVALANTDPCSGAAKTSYPISMTTATTLVVQAASASNKFYGCSIFLQAVGADNVAVVEDATGSCASPDAGVIGGTATANGVNLVANQGFTLGSGNGTVFKTASTNVNFCLITSAGVNLIGVITGVLAP